MEVKIYILLFQKKIYILLANNSLFELKKKKWCITKRSEFLLKYNSLFELKKKVVYNQEKRILVKMKRRNIGLVVSKIIF